MAVHHRIFTVGCFLAGAVSATTTLAQSYMTPYGGYQSAYDASTQLTPDQQPGTVAQPVWTSSSYTPATATIQPGSGSTPWVLNLDNSATSGAAQYPFYYLNSGTGSGTNEDFMTVDFRFQVTQDIKDIFGGDNPLFGSNINKPQLSLGISRPLTAVQAYNGESEHTYNLTFARGRIGTYNASGGTTYTSQSLGTGWHDARLVLNTRLADARLYLDGSTTAAVSFDGGNVSGAPGQNEIMFGDGSSGVVGKANIANVRWTNNSMAIPLTGGQVNVVKTTVVKTNNDQNMNYTFAHRSADGTISLMHSVGEFAGGLTFPYEVSHDNGQTWQTPPSGQDFPTINSMNLPGGGAAMVNTFDADTSAHATWGFKTYKWNSPSSGVVSSDTYSTVTFPFPVQGMLMHRSLIELDNGNWVTTLYGQDPTNAPKESAYVLGSTDQGHTWTYLSTIGGGVGPVGGYNEPSLVKLADGSLLALLRTSSDTATGPLFQTKSTDGGRTWTTPVQIADYGVDPDVIRLQNGALVASSGRPGIYIMVDFSGTGDHWQEVPLYSGTGSSYTSLVELEPNVIGLFYDESGFVGTDLDPALLPNRIVMDTIRIQAVPEPATMPLLMLGGSALMFRRARRSIATRGAISWKRSRGCAVLLQAR